MRIGLWTGLRRRLTTASMALALAVGVVMLAAPVAANAAAYPIGVYAPNQINSTQLEGWANLSRDCSGTYGCYNYIQIQVLRWYGPSTVNGWWANNNGWNSITGTLLPGCYDYRTRTDSYNYSVGDIGGGVSVGTVGVNASGQTIYDWHVEWNSGWNRICR